MQLFWLAPLELLHMAFCLSPVDIFHHLGLDPAKLVKQGSSKKATKTQWATKKTQCMFHLSGKGTPAIL